MKVYVTRKLPGKAIDMLKQHFEVEVNPEDRPPSREVLLEKVKDLDALLCLLTDKIDAELMDAAPKLKIVANYAVGYDNIDVEAATERGIVVTNTPGVLTDTTADFTWALLLAAARRVIECDKFTRAGKYKGWSPTLMLGYDVHHKTLGIIGLGRIGYAVAKRARGFEMKILYYDIRRNEKAEKELGAEFAPIERILKEADFITLHVPLTKSTYHLINEESFKLMKPTAILVNASRGPVVDEKALVKALKEKRIAYAALDVYENEPELTPGLAELENVVLAPHAASASIETRSKMGELAAQAIIDVIINNKMPSNIVNPEVWERRRK